MGPRDEGALRRAPALAQDEGGDAEARFQEAVKLYFDDRCDEALPTFRALAPMSPNARLFVARCLARDGALDLAYDEMRHTVTDSAARAVDEPRFKETWRHASDEAQALPHAGRSRGAGRAD